MIRFIKTQASYYILAKYVKCFVFYAILVLKWVDISPIVVWLIRYGFQFNVKMFKFSVCSAPTFHVKYYLKKYAYQ